MMFEWLFGKKLQCGLCGSDRMGDRPGVVIYVTDEDERIKRQICTKCSDDLDQDAEDTAEALANPDPSKDDPDFA